MKVVLANGCFDVFHIGHLWHLEAARLLGDSLIVALTLDEHVNKGPGYPIHPWIHRASVLRALRCVDDVVPSSSSLDAIRRVKPQVFVKGIDYQTAALIDERIVCSSVGAVLHITTTPKLSSRDIIRKNLT